MFRGLNLFLILFSFSLGQEEYFCRKKTSRIKIKGNIEQAFVFNTNTNGLRRYKNNVNCTASYFYRQCNKLNIECPTFNIKNKRNCKNGDYLEVNGKKFCHKKGPNFTAAKELILRFVSDKKRTANGAKCLISCLEDTKTTTTTSVNTTAATTSTTRPTTTTSTTTAVSINKGFLIVGGNGGNAAMTSSELWYRSDENTPYTSCKLPSLPERRTHGTLNGYKYCCGADSASWYSCIEFQTQLGTWVTSNSNLPPRWYDISWATANGIYLMGGESNNGQWTLDESKTTTLVKSDGSFSPGGFSMQYMTVAACAIPDGDSVVILGGQFTLKDVSRYNESGFVEALPGLNVGGGFRACAGYINNQNKMVYFAMGGLNSSYTAGTAVYSAESLVKGESQWRTIPPNGWQASWPVYSQTGITMNQNIFFFGGWNVAKYFDNIIVFDTETEIWSEAGRMKEARGLPMVSVVNPDEVLASTKCLL